MKEGPKAMLERVWTGAAISPPVGRRLLQRGNSGTVAGHPHDSAEPHRGSSAETDRDAYRVEVEENVSGACSCTCMKGHQNPSLKSSPLTDQPIHSAEGRGAGIPGHASRGPAGFWPGTGQPI